MKTVNEKLNADVGVIVGRFQVPELHDAHKDLIQTVVDNHPRVIIFLGLSPLKATANNPLDFKMRKQMIQKEFPDVDILFIKDVKGDDYWSKSLDGQINDIIGPMQSVTLYGSRDSFIKYYSGVYQTQELESDRIISGTEIRRQVSRAHQDSKDFRAGVIWATLNQFPMTVSTVDIAIMDNTNGQLKILLGRKPNEDKYRFIGGFTDPTGNGFEDDAKREVREETGLEVSDLQYIGNFHINDWRYRGEVNQIYTTFYVGYYTHGHAKPNDDIEEVRWFNWSELHKGMLVGGHDKLYTTLLNATPWEK